jgi:hypothetical protein
MDYLVKVWAQSGMVPTLTFFYTLSDLWSFLQGLPEDAKYSVYECNCVLDKS